MLLDATLTKDALLNALEHIHPSRKISLGNLFTGALGWKYPGVTSLGYPDLDDFFVFDFYQSRKIRDAITVFPRRLISLDDAVNIFEESSDLRLTDFQRLGTKGDILSMMNYWYYGAMGQDAFTNEGGVPDGVSNDALIQVANARVFYQRALEGRFGRGEYVVEKCGSAGRAGTAITFIDEIRRLDSDNGTKVLENLRYHLTDLSSRSLEEGIAVARGIDEGVIYLDKGILRFAKSDVTAPVQLEAHCKESSYLYDSISQPIIVKIRQEYFEVWGRGVLVPGGNYPLWMSEDSFRQALLDEDWHILSTIDAKVFDNIGIEYALKKIDLTGTAAGRMLKRQLGHHEIASVSSGSSVVEALQNAMGNVLPGGYLEFFDLSMEEKEPKPRSGYIVRCHGAVYQGLNLPFIDWAMKGSGYLVKVENIVDHLTHSLGVEVIGRSDLISEAKEKDSLLFPSTYLRNHKRISQIAAEVDLHHSGESSDRSAMFVEQMHREGLYAAGEPEDFYALFIETLMERYRLDQLSPLFRNLYGHHPFWVVQGESDAILRSCLTRWEESIVEHIFANSRSVPRRMNYHHVVIEKN